MDPAAKLARLDAASGFRLTLIIDPDGGTKDAVLESWVDHQAYPVAWMRLAFTDNNPLQFFRRMGACLQDSGLFSEEMSAQDENLIWEDYLTEAINDVVDFPQDFFLILDDYHLISSTEIHLALAWMLDYVPERMHLLITSRQPLPLPIPRLRLRHQLLEIDLR